ncbi:phage tail protein [Pseudomonas sp. N3-W]|uniref:phage tail protein n=1 Tax=Pseudomonas sp. N3-W TaxID=2975049 RepID=UPI00217CE3A7|nr:phage tail protein [Pseudomonas sp. N3-W]UWF51993.1 phage tail protein [Pseudomonas sp. N3-W]
MIDANSQFFAILTNVGMAKQANADALGIPWKITEMGVGDANNIDPIPSAEQTKLINEWRRRPLNQLKIDPVNPAVIIAEQVIPSDEGGHWIREIALYDADGDMVAVANCAPSFKPVLSQGSGRTQIVRMNFVVKGAGNITLKIDPAVVLATREYVDASIISVLPANKKPGTYRQVTIDKHGIVQDGSNPTTLAGYGITDALAVGQYGLGGIALAADSIDDRSLRGGFYFWGNGPTSFANNVGLLNLPYGEAGFAGQLGFVQGGVDVKIVARSVTNGGDWTPTRTLWHDGNFDPRNYAKAATTLTGYGIVLATQVEAEAGIDNAKPMTALRVAQSIAKRVVQATESVLGIAKVATQLQVEAGADDSAMVTPKKLRWGFQILKESNGYVVFPTWLGGLVIQWGYQNLPASSTTTYPFPMAFPSACASIVATFGTPAQGSVNSDIVSTNQYKLQNLYAGNQFARWIAIGY